ncbi:MAG: hypothetical protein R3D88_01490 [Alphaproteobacteria bacterium]
MMDFSAEWRGVCAWDIDGSLVPDSELRNQRGIQHTLDVLCDTNGLDRIQIEWKTYCGNSEDRIYEMLITAGHDDLEGLLQPLEFKAECLKYFSTHDPDFTPREDAIETMIALQSFNIGSIAVSNSEGRRVHRALSEAFKIADLGKQVRDVFPIVVTSDDFGPNQLRAKPSQQPYWYAHGQTMLLSGVNIPRNRMLIFEDSLPGVTSATKFIGSPQMDQVIQWKDVGAPQHPHTIHYMTRMVDCISVIAARFGINENKLHDAVANVKRCANIGLVRAIR